MSTGPIIGKAVDHPAAARTKFAARTLKQVFILIIIMKIIEAIMINQSSLAALTSLCILHECGGGLLYRDSVVVELRACGFKLHRENVSALVRVLCLLALTGRRTS